MPRRRGDIVHGLFYEGQGAPGRTGQRRRRGGGRRKSRWRNRTPT